MRKKVGNGAIWPWKIVKNVVPVMNWGNVGSQQYDHDAVCAHINMWHTITEHNGHETTGKGPFLSISYWN